MSSCFKRGLRRRRPRRRKVSATYDGTFDPKTPSRRLFGSAILACAVLVLAVTFLLLAVTPLGLRLLGAGFSTEKLALTRSLFLLLLPIVLLSAIATLWAAALNAEERFATVALAPA